MTDLDDVLRFLTRSASWTCSTCRKYGTGYRSWKDHRESSPDCAAEQDREDHVGHVHLDATGPVTDRDPTRDVSAAVARIRAGHAGDMPESLTVKRPGRRRAVCQVPDCGCTGEAHP